MILSEAMMETETFVSVVQQQFEESGSWDMASLEVGLRAALLKDGCKILEGLLNQPNALGTQIPSGTCHEKRTRNVQSILGSFTLKRGYYKNENRRSFPMDQRLGLIGSYTPGLAKLMCRSAGMDGSFDEARDTLSVYAGVDVPASQIRLVSQKVAPDLVQWSKTRDESRSEKVPIMYISYDGTGVPMRKEETQGRKGKQPDGSSATRELKLGCVFTSQSCDEEGNPLRDPDSTTYVASFQRAPDFAGTLLDEARLRGLGKAEQKVVLGDGAGWIWNQAKINFPQAVHILDYYHAREHLNELVLAIAPVEEDQDPLLEKWIKWLDDDKVLWIVEDIGSRLPRSGKRRTKAKLEREYFRKNAERMKYSTFKEKGYFVGSGVIEAGCKTVVGKRTKQSGMFWRVTGAQNILDIRCAVIGDTFDGYWADRNQKVLKELVA